MIDTDIPERGPRVLRTMPPLSRDADDYWRSRPSDHSTEGLFVGGPAGEHCAIAVLVYFTFCAVSAATPEGERRQWVANRARLMYRRACAWRDDERRPADPYHPLASTFAAVLRAAGEPIELRRRAVWNGGRFSKPAKPANSGRRKRVAA